MLSKKAKYALKALEYIARHGQESPVLTSVISDEQGIPRKFLESILLELKKDGILNSKLGKFGGYTLNMPVNEIRLGHVIRLIDGAVALVPCVSYKFYEPCDECHDEATCGLKDALAEVREATNNALNKLTLADVLLREDKLKGIRPRKKK